MDSLFPDPNAMPSGDGGLIANILAQYAAAPPDTSAPLSPIEQRMMTMTGPNQPVSGLGPAYAAQPAPAQQPAAPVQPQPQNDPIAVGSYQMPRIGSGFPDDDTPAAPSPAPAQPAQQPAPVAQANPISNFFNRAADGLESIAHGGSLLGVIRGQPTDARSVQQQQLQKQYNAYIGTGVFTPQEAQIATINLEAAKVLIAQKLGADKVKFAQLKDGLGAEHPAFINTSDQTINGQSIAAYNKSNASTEGGGALGDTTKGGAEYLATLPPQIRGTVLAVAEGRQAPPTGFAAAKPYWSKTIIPAVQQYDPSFDATNWGARASGAKDFSSGKSAETVKSLNQAIAHIGSLMGTATALNNGDYPALNWIENKASEAMGSGTQGSFRTNANAVADEVGKFFKSGNLSDHEIQEWKNNISENMSPAQQRAQIGKLSELMRGGIDALDEKRLNSIGPMAAAKQGPLVKPEAQKILQRIDDFTKGSNSGATSAVNPSAIEAEMKRRGLL